MAIRKKKAKTKNIKKSPSKKVKIFGLISIVWFLMIYSGTQTGYPRSDTQLIWFGILPLVIGWGIYLIRKK